MRRVLVLERQAFENQDLELELDLAALVKLCSEAKSGSV